MHSVYIRACTYTSAPSRDRKRNVLRAYIKHPDKNKRGMKLIIFWIRNEYRDGRGKNRTCATIENANPCVLYFSYLLFCLLLLSPPSICKAAHFETSGSQKSRLLSH